MEKQKEQGVIIEYPILCNGVYMFEGRLNGYGNHQFPNLICEKDFYDEDGRICLINEKTRTIYDCISRQFSKDYSFLLNKEFTYKHITRLLYIIAPLLYCLDENKDILSVSFNYLDNEIQFLKNKNFVLEKNDKDIIRFTFNNEPFELFAANGYISFCNVTIEKVIKNCIYQLFDSLENLYKNNINN